MSGIKRHRGITRVLAMTVGLLAASAIGAPQALADPGDIGDASLWRTSPKCSQPDEIKLTAFGIGVLEFEYRVIGGEPTTHKSRPVQNGSVGEVKTYIPERQVRWRVVAHETDITELLPERAHADIKTVDARCGNDAIQERNERVGAG